MGHSLLESQANREATLASVDGRTYPLRAARLLARAEGGMAYSTLAQVFANPHAAPLEVLYTMPLPADGAVLGYTIRIGETVIRSDVQPRERAAQAYREALYAGRTAGLLEQSRIDTFQQRLGNVPAGVEVEVTIDVLHPLQFVGEPAGGDPEDLVRERDPLLRQRAPRWEYRFPTVVNVRYTGAPGVVPDAGELSPDRDITGGIPTTMELSLRIADAVGRAVDSPSHGLDVETADGATHVRFRPGQRLDRDVVVRWDACADSVGLRVVEGGGLPGDDGRYALLTLTPPAAPRAAFARDLTVLIDASGSMAGEPLEAAKQVVGHLLGSLAPGDRFELLAFANDVRRLTPRMTGASEHELRAALAALHQLRAAGGTEMSRAVTEAMRALRGEAQRQVVLVTDGQIGFEADVVERVAGAGNVRLHAVGVGHAPNRTLTRQAAAAGRGVEVIATDGRDAADASRRLVAATASPVLTGLTLTGSALVAGPSAGLRDVFAGQPLLVAVELSPAGGVISVSGALPDGREPWTARVDVPAVGAAGAALPATTLPLGALVGRMAIGELELSGATRHAPAFDPRAHGRAPVATLDSRIEALGMRHRIASRRTSLVAIAELPSVDPTQPRRRERLAVELPHGVSAAGVGLEPEAMMMPAACMPAASRARIGFGPPLEASDATMMPPAAAGPDAVAPVLRAPSSRESFAGHVRRGIESLMLRRGPGAFVRASASWIEGGRLAIEFELPGDAFEIPAGEVALTWAEPPGRARHSAPPEHVTPPESSLGDEAMRARSVIVDRLLAAGGWVVAVDPSASTAPGRHARGLLVRIVLATGAGGAGLAGLQLVAGCAVTLEWRSSSGTQGRLGFRVPAAPATP